MDSKNQIVTQKRSYTGHLNFTNTWHKYESYEIIRILKKICFSGGFKKNLKNDIHFFTVAKISKSALPNVHLKFYVLFKYLKKKIIDCYYIMHFLIENN
jgi:hypothetical protein